jgi:hypothetical protein
MAKTQKEIVNEVVTVMTGGVVKQKKTKDLEPIEDIISRLNENFSLYYKSKAEIIDDLLKIYDHKDEYFQGKKLKKYKKDFPLFIQETFLQSKSTAYSDARIVRMLAKKDRRNVLTTSNPDKIYLCRRIASSSNKDELLDDFENLDRKNIDDKLVPFKKRSSNKSIPDDRFSFIKTELDEEDIGFSVKIESGDPEADLKLAKYIQEIVDNLGKKSLISIHEKVTGTIELLSESDD